MDLDACYAELAAAADDAAIEPVPWTLTTATDGNLVFRIDIEPPFAATLALDDDETWRVRLDTGAYEERLVAVGRADAYGAVSAAWRSPCSRRASSCVMPGTTAISRSLSQR